MQRYAHVTALNALDASTNQTSSAIDAREMIYMTVHNTSTGTATGTVKLQGSNDQNLADSNTPTNWVDIASATVSITAASQTTIPCQLCGFMYVRVVYTFASNTGTITSQVTLKGW